MHTRLTSFPLKPGAAARAEEIGKRYGKIMCDMEGHVSTVMCADDDTFTSVTTWQSEEAASSVATVRDAATADLGDLLAGAPTTVILRTVVHDTH